LSRKRKQSSLVDDGSVKISRIVEWWFWTTTLKILTMLCNSISLLGRTGFS
jgi:hypothetical protein